MANALIIVDVQSDFTPGGALGVPGGDEVIDRINELAASGDYDLVVATRDWHPPDHLSFESQGGPWPEHCVAGTPGAELDPRLDRSRIDVVIDKGQGREDEGYSAFDGTELGQLLREEHIDTITVVGLATDYCVKHTALAGVREALTTIVDTEATAGVDVEPGDVQRALEELERAGALVSATQSGRPRR